MPISEVFNMDCVAYMQTLPDKFFSLSIVDPPYGLGESVVNSGGRFKRYENKNGNWDNAIPTQDFFTELERVSENQIIWGGNYFGLNPTKCFIIWDKMQPQDISFASCEYAWTSFNSVAKTFYYRPQSQHGRFHPTQKPIALYKWLIEKYAKAGDKIFDSHMGSQSSRIAAFNMGFDYWGCELDEEYFNDGNKRFERETMQQSLFMPAPTKAEITQTTIF